jgi:outer membrane protein TolC
LLTAVSLALGPRTTAAAEDTRSALTGPVTRELLVAYAAKRDPGARAAHMRAESARESASAERALPPPELMAEVTRVPLRRPYALDDGMVMVGVRQDFPVLSALSSRAEARRQEARVEVENAQARLRDVERSVGMAFIDYAEAHLLRKAHEGHRGIAVRTHRAAQDRLAAGAPLSDVTQSELEMSAIAAQIDVQAARVEAARAELNALLLRSPQAALGEPVWAPGEPDLMTIQELVARARTGRSELRAADARIASERAELDAVRREAAVPAFSLSAAYYLPTAGMPNAYGVSGAVSLPWLWGGYQERQRATRAALEALTEERSRISWDVARDVAMAVERVTTARARRTALEANVLPAARRSFEAAFSGYVAGGTNILALLDAERRIFEFEIDLIEAETELERGIVELERALGTPMPRKPLAHDRGNSSRRENQ